MSHLATLIQGEVHKLQVSRSFTGLQPTVRQACGPVVFFFVFLPMEGFRDHSATAGHFGKKGR